jgi:hypothetical protein
MKMIKTYRLWKTDAIKKGNDYFNNDSFWLIAPSNYDAGTTRSIVMQDGKEALMISYATCGTTRRPYIWLVDENIYQKHGEWVSIIPVWV